MSFRCSYGQMINRHKLFIAGLSHIITLEHDSCIISTSLQRFGKYFNIVNNGHAEENMSGPLPVNSPHFTIPTAHITGSRKMKTAFFHLYQKKILGTLKCNGRYSDFSERDSVGTQCEKKKDVRNKK